MYIYVYMNTCMYTCMHIEVFLDSYQCYLSREFVQTTMILGPGASEVGLGAAALAPLCRDWRQRGIPCLNSAR